MTRHARLVGLIGANIKNSLSPALHEDAFAARGIVGHYHLMDLDRLAGRKLEQILQAVKVVGFSGVNVTFPVKQSILPLLDEVSADARQIGAVNTVTITESGHTTGYNTDRSGFRRSVEQGLGAEVITGRKVVLVGSGGAGRAVAFALMDLGCAHLAVHDIDAQRATATIADLMQHYPDSRCSYAPDVVAAAAEAGGIVNATPVGMLGVPGMPVPAEALRRDHFVADVIYSPMETELIVTARRKGCRVLTGGGMCVHQAADAFRLFSGLEPDIERMHRTFAAALAARDAALAAVA
jgi:shikimate dehydrogenase